MSEQAAAQHDAWTPAWVQQITGGRWFGKPAAADLALMGLGIDSRSIERGEIFLAVKGENYDGHMFVDQAIQAGAAIAIIDSDTKQPNIPGVLRVDNTVEALQQLAGAHRELLRDAGCTVIAVAGSNGKTTTRHLIHTVLSSSFAGTQSPKSFNNHLGVPLTLLGASVDDRFVVAEVGTNHPGEVDALGAILKPDAAVITSIGREHMEFFGDLEGVAHEEACITQHLPSEGMLFIESDAYAWVRDTRTFHRPAGLVVYGEGEQAIREDRQLLGDRQRFAISKTMTIDLCLLGAHDISNALAAAEVGRWMGIKDEAIKAALETARPMPGRLDVKHVGSVTIIDDTYNANPDSVRAALDVLAGYPIDTPNRRIAVLGDMLELGDLSTDAHREVGEILVRLAQAGKIQHITLVGPLMVSAYDLIKESSSSLSVTYYPVADAEALGAVVDMIRPGEVVLCKSSRGLELDRLIPMFEDRFNECS